MGFSITARGIGYSLKPFHYNKEECIDGDTFELVDLLSSACVQPTPRGGAWGIMDYLWSETMTESLISSLGNMVLLNAINTQVSKLAMHSRKRDPYIFLTARESNLFSPDAYEIAKYTFYKSVDPGKDFLKAILPALKATDMNNYGVARELLSVLVHYDEMISNSDPVQIMIEVWK